MIRGTTPIHEFNTDIDLTDAAVIYLTYKIDNGVVFEKTKDDLDVTAEGISCKLTQEETLQLRAGTSVKIQIRTRFEDGTALASNIMHVTVEQILKEGVI